jgi:hypothetical protein
MLIFTVSAFPTGVPVVVVVVVTVCELSTGTG